MQILSRLAIFMILLFISWPGPSQGALKAVGPQHPEHGFPLWYQDSKGLMLELCLDALDLKCAEPPPGLDPNKPILFPTNFPKVAYWWMAQTEVAAEGGGVIRLFFALEAAFRSDLPRAGDRIVTSRIRIVGTGLPIGAYKITHPYGVQEFNVTSSSERQIDFSSDVEDPKLEDFNTALSGPLGPFLVWDPAISPQAPAGYIGDPNFPHKVTGSPRNTNYVRVELRSPGREYRGVGFTDLFAVAGKVAKQVDPRGAPRVDAPSFELREYGGVNDSEEVSVRLNWTASPGVARISSFQLESNYNRAGYWRVDLRNPAEPSANLSIAPGPWQFRVRAIDVEGRPSGFAAVSYRLNLLSEFSPSISYSGGPWSSDPIPGAVGGKVKSAQTEGAAAVVKFTGTGIGWVASKSSRGGSAEILIDGVSQGNVDLYSATTRNRQFVFIKNGLRAGPHTLTIRSTGRRNEASSGTRINIDAFAITTP